MRWARAGDPRVRVDEPSRREALITLVDFTALGPVLFVWRALTQWLGGIGIIVLFVGLYPYLAIACLGNIGPGLGAVGPMESFAWLHPGAKGVLIFLMLAGRLEVVSLFALASRDAWRPARQRA